MRIFKTVLITLTFFFFSMNALCYGADVAKIGVVDFQKILEQSSAGKSAQAEINKKGKEMEEDLKKKGAEIESTKKKLEREALVMSKEMREGKEREIRIQINDFKILQKNFLKEFKTFEQRLVQRIQKEVLNIVEEVGKKEGYLIILEKRESGLLYAPDAIDITDKLIQRYNTVFAGTSRKSK